MLYRLGEMSEYGIGDTPTVKLGLYCNSGNLYLKLERKNFSGSIKDRAAYYIIRDLVNSGRLRSNINLVESSSGNLGLALGFLTNKIGVSFTCLVDPTISGDKLSQLKDMGIRIHIVSKGSNPDFREARIKLAKRLDSLPNWIWTNQYDNLSNFFAHYETTGPEIWMQTNGKVDYLVCSIGTGGTVCGIAKYLKGVKPDVKIVAVEPAGSTIFGGIPGNYLNAGAGMLYPSGIVLKFGKYIDLYCQIEDERSIQECVKMYQKEGISGGITTGSVLSVASMLANENPEKMVVALSADGGEKYSELQNAICDNNREFPKIEIGYPKWIHDH